MTEQHDAGLDGFAGELSALQHDLDQHQAAVRELRTVAEARLAEIEAMAAQLVQLEAARDAAQLEERRRVVAYLRAAAEVAGAAEYETLANLASAIERGEHRS